MTMEINRRNFLHGTAGLGMGMVLSDMVSAQPEENKADDLNIVLIGADNKGEVLVCSCI